MKFVTVSESALESIKRMGEQQNARIAELEADRDKLLKALGAMLTHMGMDEDEWNKPTFDQARAAINKARNAPSRRMP